jgi:hypothetical protein
MTEVEKLYKELGSHKKVAEALGIAKSTVWKRLQDAKESGHRLIGDGVSIPPLPADNLPIDERIDILCRKFEAKKRAYDLNTWFDVQVHEDLPIGMVMFGDPHLDNSGANWPLIKSHARLVSSTPGCYGVNIGDTTDNWTGGLARLYAHNGVTLKEARDLVDWFMHGSGIPWLVWLVGNHDAWGDGATILDLLSKKYGTKKVVAHEWEARFRVVFPNAGNKSYKINCAHNFPGNSQWNPLHGLSKAAMLKEDADILACGHLHNYAYATFENSNRGKVQHLLRVRGYKHCDGYARALGIYEQEHGSSGMFVMDPWAKEEPAQLMFFPSVEGGCDYLNMIRDKRKNAASQTKSKTRNRKGRD